MPEPFQPRLPHGIPNEGGGIRRGENVEWEMAPDSSGVHSFRFRDGRSTAYGIGRGRSELHVRFKRKTGGVTRPYVYLFSDHDKAEELFAEMQFSRHPFTEVALPKLIKSGVPYSMIV